MMVTKTTLEHQIRNESQTLAHCADLLGKKIPLALWNATIRDAFLLALFQPLPSGPEKSKQWALQRHLGVMQPLSPSLVAHPSVDLIRKAERLRSDLMDLSLFKKGTYLG